MALISADELHARLDDPDLRIVDVRFQLADHGQGRRDYDAAHLPGAVFADLHTELSHGADAGSPDGRHPLPSVDEFRALLDRLGIAPGTFVVAYDDLGGAIAARLWWMLRSIGHGRVAVLDGGFGAWTAAGYPLTDAVPEITPSAYPPVGDWTGVVDADAVVQAIEMGGSVVDARGPERFRGDVEPIDVRGGHIPGAVNRFHGAALDEHGRHRPVAELVELFGGIGSDPIVYCGSGVTACHALLAMSLVGFDGGRLYPGSWSAWAADANRPIATGDA